MAIQITATPSKPGDGDLLGVMARDVVDPGSLVKVNFKTRKNETALYYYRSSDKKTICPAALDNECGGIEKCPIDFSEARLCVLCVARGEI